MSTLSDVNIELQEANPAATATPAAKPKVFEASLGRAGAHLEEPSSEQTPIRRPSRVPEPIPMIREPSLIESDAEEQKEAPEETPAGCCGKKTAQGPPPSDPVRDQTLNAKKHGTIWNAVTINDKETIERKINEEHGTAEEKAVKVLTQVGAVGDCPWLLLFLYCSPDGIKIALEYLEKYPQLVFSKYHCEPVAGQEYSKEMHEKRCFGMRGGVQQYRTPFNLYENETALHLAVVNNNVPVVQTLLKTQVKLRKEKKWPRAGQPDEQEDLMDMGAWGIFFSPPYASTTCYYGRYPLGFAVCTNNKKVTKILLDYGELWARGRWLTRQDDCGNNLIHLCVIHGLVDMCGFVLEQEKNHITELEKEIKRMNPEGRSLQTIDEWAEKEVDESEREKKKEQSDFLRKLITQKDEMLASPMLNVLNNDLRTPLTLSAFTGHKDMFEFITTKVTIIQWIYGPIKCTILPIEELDTLELGLGGDLDQDLCQKVKERKEYLKEEYGRRLKGVDKGELCLYCLNGHGEDGCPRYQGYEEKVEALEFKGALDLMISETHLELISTNMIRDLVSEKWNKYAKKGFHKRLRMVSAYVLCFTMASLLGAPDYTNYNLSKDMAARDVCRIIFEIVVVLGSLWKGFTEGGEMLGSGWGYLLDVSGAAFLENAVSSSMLFLNLIVIVLRIVAAASQGTSFRAENFFMSVDVVFTWFYALTNLLAFELTGPMLVMMYTMVTQDVFRWVIIFCFLLMMFSASVAQLEDNAQCLALAETEPMDCEDALQLFYKRIIIFFYMMMGDIDIDTFNDSLIKEFRPLGTLASIAWVVLITLLLLNLLIAMMGNTYEQVKERSTQEWNKFLAQIVQSIEGEMSIDDFKSSKYWMDINPTPVINAPERRFIQTIEAMGVTTSMDNSESEDAMTKFDANNDGVLDDSEIQAFLAQIPKMMQKQAKKSPIENILEKRSDRA